ncbi:hypothetical protein PR048_002167 [Dryococelus australis]|uniref:Uncharacterized protein n=1 Tax=Dryococelus australis TaxID=614101 RepID=A0ABQ9IJF5_9NEOP|nr:hypothetical protein PR048_002167 [Dryococelus australis]
MTVSRRLRTQGMHPYMALRKPLQTAVSRKKQTDLVSSEEKLGDGEMGKGAVQRRVPLRTLFLPPYSCSPYTHREVSS